MTNLPGVGRAHSIVLALALALAGCDSPFSPTDDLEAARRTWRQQGIASYSFKVSQFCFCVAEGRGTFDVVVEQGRVVSVADAETGAPRTPYPAVPLTVEALFARVEDAIDAARRGRSSPLGPPGLSAGDCDRLRRARRRHEVTYTDSDLAPIR